MALSSQKWFSYATFNWVPLKLFTNFQWLRSTLLRKNKKIWDSIQKVQVSCLKHLKKWKFSMCPNYALKLLQNKSKQTNQIFITKLKFHSQFHFFPETSSRKFSKLFTLYCLRISSSFLFFVKFIWCFFKRNKFGHYFSRMVQRDKKKLQTIKNRKLGKSNNSFPSIFKATFSNKIKKNKFLNKSNWKLYHV
jgi:hypothetical protein